MVAAVIVAALLAQTPVPGVELKKPDKKSRTPVVAVGCIRLPEFKILESDLGGIRTVRLRGKKSTMALLKEHLGHVDELTGFLDEGDRAMGGTKEKNVGDKSRIYIGARSETIDKNTALLEPEFDVQSIKHLGRMCSGS